VVQGEELVVRIEAARQEGEPRNRSVSILSLALREIDRAAVETTWGTCLESCNFEAQGPQAVTQSRYGIAHPPTSLVLFAHVEQTTHEGSGADHDGPGSDAHAERGIDARDGTVFNDQLSDIALMHIQARGSFKDRLHPKLVGLLVTLGPWSTDAGALVDVKDSELNPCGISINGHDSTQSINLAHHVPLRQTANGWVAGHLADSIEVLREESRLGTQACGGKCGLDASMSSAYNEDIVMFRISKMFHVER
jgi:hypothetical protein